MIKLGNFSLFPALENGRVKQVCPVPRLSNGQSVRNNHSVSGAHKAGDAGIVETNDVTGQAGHGPFPLKDAKLRACKGLLGCHAADALSAGVVWGSDRRSSSMACVVFCYTPNSLKPFSRRNDHNSRSDSKLKGSGGSSNSEPSGSGSGSSRFLQFGQSTTAPRVLSRQSCRDKREMSALRVCVRHSIRSQHMQRTWPSRVHTIGSR